MADNIIGNHDGGKYAKAKPNIKANDNVNRS